MRVAVVGSGLAGLGVTYFLIKKGCSVTLFDEIGVGAGASGIPIGLCHPYVGRSGKPSQFSDEAMDATRELLDAAEKSSGKIVSDRNGILRVDWEPSEWYSDLERVDGGILIRSGITVQMKEYVIALYESFENVSFVQKKVEGDLEEFDRIVYASGTGMKRFDLPLKFVKGQVLLGTSKGSFDRTVMKAQGHLSPIHGKIVQVGSTYEHHFSSASPDREVAKKDLSKKISAFFPDPSDFHIEDCRAGIRTCVKEGYLPIVKKWDERHFLFTGLGSRGLLYHAYYGRHLAGMIV